MIPNPITIVLSSMQRNGVRCLLMGGQACILYGAAGFSRDIDFALSVDSQNLNRLRQALKELEAGPIAVPPFEPRSLDRGHALHFRCKAPGVDGLRIDLMSRMRGVDAFADLWERRSTVSLPEGLEVNALSLPDLIKAKRTQLPKDWVMANRLVEAHYAQSPHRTDDEAIKFWLTESFEISFLAEVADRFPAHSRQYAEERLALRFLLDGKLAEAASAIQAEQEAIMQADRDYWAPLIAELYEMRKRRS